MASGDASGVIYLVDAHSLIFQVFHAIPAMTSPTGLPTNAVFGFVRDLLYLRKRNPDYLVCRFRPAAADVSQRIVQGIQSPSRSDAYRFGRPMALNPAGGRGSWHTGRHPSAF